MGVHAAVRSRGCRDYRRRPPVEVVRDNRLHCALSARKTGRSDVLAPRVLKRRAQPLDYPGEMDHPSLSKPSISTLWRARRHFRNSPIAVWLRLVAGRRIVLRTRDGLRIGCRPNSSDWRLVHELCGGARHATAFRYLAKRDRRGLILDLGAGPGCFSLLCADLSRDAHVLAYEAEASSVAQFQANLALNPRLADRIVLDTRAVSGVAATPGPTPGGVAADVPFATLIRQLAGPIELVRIDVPGAGTTLVEETPADVWERIPAIAMAVHHDGTPSVTRQQLMRRFESLGFVVSSEPGGSWFIERTGPRWRRSTVQSPAA